MRGNKVFYRSGKLLKTVVAKRFVRLGRYIGKIYWSHQKWACCHE